MMRFSFLAWFFILSIPCSGQVSYKTAYQYISTNKEIRKDIAKCRHMNPLKKAFFVNSSRSFYLGQGIYPLSYYMFRVSLDITADTSNEIFRELSKYNLVTEESFEPYYDDVLSDIKFDSSSKYVIYFSKPLNNLLRVDIKKVYTPEVRSAHDELISGLSYILFFDKNGQVIDSRRRCFVR